MLWLEQLFIQSLLHLLHLIEDLVHGKMVLYHFQVSVSGMWVIQFEPACPCPDNSRHSY